MSGLRFSKQPLAENVLVDLQKINGFNESQLQAFVNIILRFLARKGDIVSDVAEFGSQHGVNQQALRSIVQAYLFFFRNAIRQNLSVAHVKEDLVKIGVQDPKANIVAESWQENYVDLCQSAISQTLTVNELVDLEWKFGVTASNSEMKRVGASFLQLKLVLDKGHSTETVHMELTLPQFYEFLAEMEKAKANLEYFS